MALTPELEVPEIIETEVDPSLTYEFDFDTKQIKRKIDGRKAIEQFIRKAIVTIRFIHPIYSDDYGCEVRPMIGQGFTDAFLKSEIQRMITEAIIYDDRINKVYDFDIQPKGDETFTKFSVDTVEGILDIKEVIRG